MRKWLSDLHSVGVLYHALDEIDNTFEPTLLPPHFEFPVRIQVVLIYFSNVAFKIVRAQPDLFQGCPRSAGRAQVKPEYGIVCIL
jgi:hypothetical protein